MFLLIGYRAEMNAFLSVKSFNVPIGSWEDVLTTDLDVIIQDNPYTMELFSMSHPDSTFYKIYQEKIMGQKTFAEHGGKEGVMSALVSGKALYIGELIWIFESKQYPCTIIDIKYFR